MTREVRLYTALLSVIALSVVALPEPRVDAQTAPPAPTISLLRNNALNGAVVIGDLNNDERIDAVASDPWSLPGPVIIAALGLGNGRFGAPIRSAWRGTPLTLGVFNNDGFLDLVIMADAPTPGLYLLPGKGDGTFGTAIKIGSGGRFVAPFAMSLDYNDDGKDDLAVGHADELQDNGVEIFPSNGDGTFGPSAFLSTGFNSQPLAATSGDLDTDIALNIIVANHQAHSITFFRHQTGLLFSASDIPLDEQVNAVRYVDLNLDGRVDLVAATSRDADDDRLYVDGHVQVLIATATGYAPPVKYQTPPGTWKMIGGDFNRDGKYDVATANRSATFSEDSCGSLWDTVTILPGNGDGTFAAPSSFSLGDQRFSNDSRFHNSVLSLAAADLTGDGPARTDIITSWGAVLVNNPPDPNWGPSVSASSSQPDPDTHRIQLNAAASDVDQDMLSFTWSESGGQFIDPVPNPCFDPNTLGVHTFTVTVNDGHGHTATSSVTVDFGGEPAPYTPPTATFSAPVEGEIITAGQPYTIRWSVTPGSHPITRINLQSWIETSPPTVISECTNLPATAASCVWNSPGPISETAHISVGFVDTTGRSNGTTSARFIIRGSSGGGGTLAYGWTASDVGAVAAAGQTTHNGFVYNGEGLKLTGSGADIWNAADEFHYAWRTLSGDFEVLTRVSSIDPVNPWTKAGLMLRAAATDPLSPHVSIFATPSKGVVFQRRTLAGGASTSTAGPALTAPLWLRMIRMGDVIKAFYRKNPTDTWTLLGQQAVNWAPTVNVGLAVTSHADGTLATAKFEGVWTSALPQLAGRAIGAATGSVTWDGTTYTVKGSGTDIWGTSDGFFFVEMPIGEFRMLTARVRVVGNTDPWAKAGVMIRENLAADSRHADMVVTPSKGIAFQYRASPGGTSASAALGAGAAPILLRIIRSENASGGPASFDAMYSTNGGLLWRAFCCAAPMPMNHLARIGIAVSSHKPGVETTAVVDDVRIEP
jgi:Big-like domain-containing protein/VCBS repeat protein